MSTIETLLDLGPLIEYDLTKAKYLGRGMLGSEHIADLYILPGGLPASFYPGTNKLIRMSPDEWRRLDNGDWIASKGQ